MNEDTGSSHGRWGRPGRAGSRRAGVLAAAVAGTALLAAACGGNGSGGGTSAAARARAYQKALGYTQCMRAHGDPGFPDPSKQGTFPSSTAQESAQFQAANNDCGYLLLGTVSPVEAAAEQKRLAMLLKYSECVRAHGVTDFPDPALLPGGGMAITLPTSISPDSPLLKSASQACQQELPGPRHGRTHGQGGGGS
jgi:hypothetical protein